MTIDWVKLELDVMAFDPSAHLATQQRVVDSGISFATLAGLGDNDTNRRRLYEFNKEVSADIPGRGTFHTWDEYQEARLRVL